MFALPSAIDVDGRRLCVVAILGEVPMLHPRFLLRMDAGPPTGYASTTCGWPTIPDPRPIFIISLPLFLPRNCPLGIYCTSFLLRICYHNLTPSLDQCRVSVGISQCSSSCYGNLLRLGQQQRVATMPCKLGNSPCPCATLSQWILVDPTSLF